MIGAKIQTSPKLNLKGRRKKLFIREAHKGQLIYFVLISFPNPMEKRYPVARRSSKRKLEADLTEDQTHTKASKISAKILKQVSLLNSAAIPFTALDCATVKSAVHSLSVLAANGTSLFFFVSLIFVFRAFIEFCISV